MNRRGSRVYALYCVQYCMPGEVSSKTACRTWVLQPELICSLSLRWFVYHIKLLIAFHIGLVIRYFIHVRINESLIVVGKCMVATYSENLCFKFYLFLQMF